MKKLELKKLIKEILLEISSNNGSYNADEGEPDTG